MGGQRNADWKKVEIPKNHIKVVFARSVGYNHIIYFSYSRETFHGPSGASAKKEKNIAMIIISKLAYGILFTEIKTNHTSTVYFGKKYI